MAAQFRRNLVRPDNGEGGDIASFLFEQHIPGTNAMRYKGKTVMLIDERAISQSEHSGLFYKAANGTVFIGSPTTGANGDVTSFSVPGGIRIGFSGHDVRWPDGKQLQRAGLAPDVPVSPTIAGIRAGKDGGSGTGRFLPGKRAKVLIDHCRQAIERGSTAPAWMMPHHRSVTLVSDYLPAG